MLKGGEFYMEKIKMKFDVMKWAGWIIAVALLVGISVYLVTVRQQVWFAITQPKAVSACIEGYTGEHAEADKRFETKQRSEVISPLVEEAKKE